MRRIPALLLAATLAAAPASAAASPSPDSRSTSSTIQRFEWSTTRGRLGVNVMNLTPELRRVWFGFEPRPSAMPAWLCKLRELTFPSRPDPVCRRA